MQVPTEARVASHRVQAQAGSETAGSVLNPLDMERLIRCAVQPNGDVPARSAEVVDVSGSQRRIQRPPSPGRRRLHVDAQSYVSPQVAGAVVVHLEIGVPRAFLAK